MTDDAQAQATDPVVPAPFATPGHLYLLVAGLLVGVLLGPAVLGRVSPATYDAWFLGGGEDAAKLAREEAAIDQQIVLLRGVGVTDVAADELVLRETQRLAPLRVRVQTAQEERQQAVHGWLFAIMAAIVLLAAAEPLVAPDVRAGARAILPRSLAGLVTARYGLLATWVAIVVAKPTLLAEVSWWFVAATVLVAAAAALVPLTALKTRN